MVIRNTSRKLIHQAAQQWLMPSASTTASLSSQRTLKVWSQTRSAVTLFQQQQRNMMSGTASGSSSISSMGCKEKKIQGNQDGGNVESSSSSNTSKTTACHEEASTSSSDGEAAAAAASSATPILVKEPMKAFPLTTDPNQLSPMGSYLHKRVPSEIVHPVYANNRGGFVPYSVYNDQIMIHDENSADKMKEAAYVARSCLDLACDLAEQEGITTDEIDTIVHNTMIEHYNVYPSPLNYSGFPKSLCSSINEVICHGIPDTRPLKYGDIVSFDVSCYTSDLVHGDNCATVIVGDYDRTSKTKTEDAKDVELDWRGNVLNTNFCNKEEEEHFLECRRLLNATRESLYSAINVCKPGGCLSDIGSTIQDVADRCGYNTVRKYRGHGIHHIFHCAPYVKHYKNDDYLELVPGMIFTIEPMLTQKSKNGDDYDDDCYEWDDNWTVATIDGGLSAQFEHTILITEDGAEILTTLDEEKELKFLKQYSQM